MRGPASQLPDDAGLPLSATGTWTDSKLTTELDNSPACGKAAATAVTAAIPVLIQPPHTLSIGTEWKDSSVSIGCAGTISLKAITQRTYRVTGEASAGQQKGITIDETETTELSGEGADGQHYVRINGQGTGKGQLVIDPRDGTVLQIRTDSQNQISITASGRSQVFEQQLKKEISRTN